VKRELRLAAKRSFARCKHVYRKYAFAFGNQSVAYCLDCGSHRVGGGHGTWKLPRLLTTPEKIRVGKDSE
jgi:hypothetical protein